MNISTAKQLLVSLFITFIMASSLSACLNKGDKSESESTIIEEDVVMSAQPADEDDPVLVADDLDDVDVESVNIDEVSEIEETEDIGPID